ncbi:MAG TPA: PEGA domain-containing protein [Verrucomicrobiae bacterium]|nr:PEGA domain-containing protein [Verrucomicrobiae bacterium]
MRLRQATLSLGFCWIAFFPGAASPQMPSAPARLIVLSSPQGATILIDGQSTGQATPKTFVVAPRTYKVSLFGAGGNSACATPAVVTLASGQSKTVNCATNGWTIQ